MLSVALAVLLVLSIIGIILGKVKHMRWLFVCSVMVGLLALVPTALLVASIGFNWMDAPPFA